MTSVAAACLLLQCVLQAADGVLNLALGLLALSLGGQLRIADGLTGRLLDRALRLLGRACDAILVHVVTPLVDTARRYCQSARGSEPSGV
jgi:hypothetical protein